jgi:hypothetical protein
MKLRLLAKMELHPEGSRLDHQHHKRHVDAKLFQVLTIAAEITTNSTNARIVRSFNISRSRTGIASTPCGRMTRNRTLTAAVATFRAYLDRFPES